MEPFARGFLGCDSEILIKRIACGFLLANKETTFTFTDTYLPNAHRGTTLIYHDYGTGINTWGPEYLEEFATKNPEDADDLRNIFRLMKPYMNYEYVKQNLFTPQMKNMKEACWGGGWRGHAVPAFWEVCTLGTYHFRKKVAKYREINKELDKD
ncbi:MAG: hypothetical protein IJC98_01250, partial [Clostridia bacterium]|nr:hypothetical protein [Clostridia bacterium]